MGLSGGYQSARSGPSMSPGGSAEAYKLVEPILRKIAAHSDVGPCVAYIGPQGAGHYVKMAHNGIEQGMMSSIVEVYSIMRSVLGMDHVETHKIFQEPF